MSYNGTFCFFPKQSRKVKSKRKRVGSRGLHKLKDRSRQVSKSAKPRKKDLFLRSGKGGCLCLIGLSHRRNGVNKRKLFSHSSRGCKSKIRVLVWLVLVTALFLIVESCLHLCPHMASACVCPGKNVPVFLFS